MDMDDLVSLELLSNHPTFRCKKHKNKRVYSGSLLVNADRYRIKIEERDSGHGIKRKLIDLNESLRKFKDKLENLDKPHSNISTYVSNLEEIIRNDSYLPKNHTSFYRRVLYEYSEFTKFFIDLKSSCLSPDLSSIHAAVYDDNRREHKVEYAVDYNESINIFYLKSYDLPVDQNKTLDKKSSSLLDLHNIFLGYIENLEPYFNLMDTIDSNSYVVDPKNPLKKYNYRRIWLEENIWVIITIYPYNIKTLPNFAFLGCETLISDYWQKLNKNLETWNGEQEHFHQILNMLGLEQFPRPQESAMMQNSDEILLRDDSDCSICFSSDLDGKLPEIVCNNKCCANLYHKDCLYQWLLSIKSQTISNEIKGPCPNCEKMITCPILEFL